MPKNDLSKSKTSLLSKFKGIFVYEDQDQITSQIQENFDDNNQLVELQNEHDHILKEINLVIQGKTEDFTPQFDIPRLHQIQKQMKDIETSHHEVDTFWEKIKERIFTLIPILILLLPDSNPLKAKLLNLQESHEDINESDFLKQIEGIIHQISDQENKNITNVTNSLQSFKNKKIANEKLFEDTLNNIEQYLLETADNYHQKIQDLKTPEELEKQILELITNYKGRELGKSDKPLDDRFKTEILLRKLQDYKQWYAQYNTLIEISKKQSQNSLNQTIHDYISLVQKELNYDVESMSKNLDNYLSSVTNNQNNKTSIVQYFDQYKNLKNQITKTINKQQKLQERVSYFFLHPLLLDFQNPQETKETIQNSQRQETIQDKITVILKQLRVRYDTYVQQFSKDSYIQDINQLQTLQQEYEQKLSELNQLAQSFTQIKEKIIQSGGTISTIKHINKELKQFQTNNKEQIILNLTNLVDFYSNLSKSLGTTHIILEKMDAVTLTANVQKQLEQSLQDCIFDDLTDQKKQSYFENDDFCVTREDGDVVVANNSIKQLEQQRKSQAFQFLKDNNMDTPGYRTMINNVQYTKESINFTNPANGATIPRKHENAKASDFGITYTVDDKKKPTDYKKAHVFKGEGVYADEHYFNYAMVDKIAKQGAKVPSYQDMRNTLAALPGGPSGTPPKSPTSTGREVGSAKLMSILLGAEKSGCRGGGEREDCGSCGYLWSRSESSSSSAWACGWDASEGILDDCTREYARPLRLLV